MIKLVKNPFKKKTEKEEGEEVETTTNHIEAKSSKKETKEPTKLEEYIKSYQKYRGTFTPADFTGLRPDSEICTLLFAIFCELKKLNEIKNINKNT